jgi:hypothetical protein
VKGIRKGNPKKKQKEFAKLELINIKIEFYVNEIMRKSSKITLSFKNHEIFRGFLIQKNIISLLRIP